MGSWFMFDRKDGGNGFAEVLSRRRAIDAATSALDALRLCATPSLSEKEIGSFLESNQGAAYDRYPEEEGLYFGFLASFDGRTFGHDYVLRGAFDHLVQSLRALSKNHQISCITFFREHV